jgi:hypothetical protein
MASISKQQKRPNKLALTFLSPPEGMGMGDGVLGLRRFLDEEEKFVELLS